MLISLVRTVILYVVLIAIMRFLGKRQIGELEPSELVITILVSELAAIPMQDPDIPLLSGLVPIFVLVSLGLLTSVMGAQSPKLRKLMYGKPSIIIDNGTMIQKEMQRLRISVDELSEELRLSGVTQISTVRYAIVETNGRISVILKQEEEPVTRRDLQIQPESVDPIPITLISDGKIMQENLRLAGMTRPELLSVIRTRGVHETKDVFYLAKDKDGNYRLISKEKV